MNVFMGYNPLATKQAKVTVWVCEQDGETPVAPSNPSEGDCFVVYATDEAVLSNTPTSAKSYSNGEWVDAEGGGGAVIPTITLLTMPSESTRGTYSSDVPYDDMRNAIRNSAYINIYMRSVIPIYVAFDGVKGGRFIAAHLDSQGNISLGVSEETTYVFYEDGTFEIVGLSHE